jgi:hypothetical protein
MKREAVTSFGAAIALSLALILALANPTFAGVSNFSVNPIATFVPGRNNKQVIVTGTVTCPSGKVLTIGVHIVQQGTMIALARGEIRGLCGVANSWKVIASSPDTMQKGSASMLAGAWLCTPSPFGIRPTGPCEFAHTSGDITLK